VGLGGVLWGLRIAVVIVISYLMSLGVVDCLHVYCGGFLLYL